MKLIKKTLLFLCVLLCFMQSSEAEAFLGLFADKNIETVREGIYDFDRSLTLGNALEGNQYFTSPEWTSFEDSQKRQYVQFSANFNIGLLHEQLKEIHAVANTETLTLPIKLLIEFTINTDGSYYANFLSFDSDIGSLYTPATIDEVINSISTFYQNDLPLPLVEEILRLLNDAILDAIYSNNLELLTTLINFGFDPTIRTSYGSWPLSVAVDGNNKGIVQVLLESGASPNIESGINTPVMRALSMANNDMIQLLIDNGAHPIDYNIDQNFIEAVRYNNLNIVKALLEYGANPNIITDTGENLFSIMDYQGPQMFTLLSNYGLNLEGTTAENFLYNVCTSGNTDFAKLLIEQGIKINKVAGEHLLTIAIEQKDLNFIQLLLENGANPNYTNPKSYSSPLVDSILEKNYDLMLLLVKNGADLFAAPSAMKAIAASIDMKAVEALILNGIDINAQDQNGETLLMYATTPSQYWRDFVAYLLKNGANIDLQDNSGKTALMRVASESMGSQYSAQAENIIRQLLGSQANLFIKDNKGLTAIDLAKNGMILQLLEQYAATKPSPEDDRKKYIGSIKQVKENKGTKFYLITEHEKILLGSWGELADDPCIYYSSEDGKAVEIMGDFIDEDSVVYLNLERRFTCDNL